MKKSILVVLALLVSIPTAYADEAYPEAKSQRPLVLSKGLMEMGLDFGGGLNKDRVFKDMTLEVRYAIGIIDNLEVGVGIRGLDYAKDVYDAKFGGATLYGRYSFLEFLGAELEVFFPGDRTYLDEFGDQLLGVNVGVPFEYIIMKNMLKVHAGLALDVGFVADTYETSGGESPQMRLLLDYGVTYNPLRQLFLDLSFGTNMGLKPSAGDLGDRVAIPAALTVGGTLLSGDLDIYASFVLGNLKPVTGDALDQRMLGIGAMYRL